MKDLIEQNAQEPRKPDDDLQSAFNYNPIEDFSIAEISDVKAAVYGENDGCDWYWLVAVDPNSLAAQAGPFALLSGGCDYTGWDCQSNLGLMKQGSLDECLNASPVEDSYKRRIRETLAKQLSHGLPFGVIERA